MSREDAEQVEPISNAQRLTTPSQTTACAVGLLRVVVGADWYAIALFGPTLLFLLDEGVHLLLGGAPPKHWIVLPSLSDFLPGSLFFVVMGVLAGSFGEEFGWRGCA